MITFKSTSGIRKKLKNTSHKKKKNEFGVEHITRLIRRLRRRWAEYVLHFSYNQIGQKLSAN